MKDRILKFLKVENISPSKFADEIGVQRSSISHILSGRNNPSLELIQKILIRFNYINAEWLITGKGEMYKPEREPTIFDQLAYEDQNVQEIEKSNLTQEKISEPLMKSDIDTNVNLQNVLQTSKIIDKIILLYSDGTASAYEMNK